MTIFANTQSTMCTTYKSGDPVTYVRTTKFMAVYNVAPFSSILLLLPLSFIRYK